MIKITKIILSILLLFALLAVSGCTGANSNADDVSTDTAGDTNMKESEDSTTSEEVDVLDTNTNDTDVDGVDNDGTGEEEIIEAVSINATVSTNATSQRCGPCHQASIMDEMMRGVHEGAFKDGASAIHVDKCKECHNVKTFCAECHALPEIVKVQTTS